MIWWLGLPAMAFAAWQAFKRRSLAPGPRSRSASPCQWVSWARIDRASFQYHYYTSLPFLFLALAYFLAELWHGAVAPDVAARAADGRGRRSSGRRSSGSSTGRSARFVDVTKAEPGLAGLPAGHPGSSC